MGIAARSRLARFIVVAAACVQGFDSVHWRRTDDDRTNLIIIEPETNSTHAPRVSVHESDDTSGGGFVSIRGWETSNPQYGRIVAGETTYPIDVAVTGEYYFWVRAMWSGPCANSVTLRSQQTATITQNDPAQTRYRYLVGNDSEYSRWHWVRGPGLKLTAGPRHLVMGTTESVANVDTIVISPNPDFDPRQQASDALPSSSRSVAQKNFVFQENFASASLGTTPLSFNWVTDHTGWKVFRHLGLSATGPLCDEITMAQARTNPFSDADIQCSLILSARVGAGIFFGRTSPTEYFVVRMASEHASKPYASKIQLGRVNKTEVEVLAETEVTLSAGVWQLLGISTVGKHCQVYLATNPMLSVELPREPKGHAGLYVDSQDEMLSSSETLFDLQTNVNQTAGIKTLRFLPPSPSPWGGIAIGYTPEQTLLARWTNVARDQGYAKRLEILEASSSGASTVLAEQWGVFPHDDAANLELNWDGERITASVGGRAACSATARPLSGVTATLQTNQPKALFGDFFLKTRHQVTIPEHKAAVAGGKVIKEEPSPDALNLSDLENQRTFPLAPIEHSQGILSVLLHRSDLPCGFNMHIASKNKVDSVWLRPKNDGQLAVEFQPGETPAKGFGTATRVLNVEESFSAQIWVGDEEMRAFVNGVPALSVGRLVSGEIGMIDYLSRNDRNRLPPMLIVEDMWQPDYFVLGYGWPVDQFKQRYVYGDAMVELVGLQPQNLLLGDRATGWELRMHAAFNKPKSGYRVRAVGSRPVRVGLHRNRELVDKLVAGDLRETTRLSLLQVGRLISWGKNTQRMSGFWDSKAFRQGYIAVVPDQAKSVSTSLKVRVLQPWDSVSYFYHDDAAGMAAALWQPNQGAWHLEEFDGRMTGTLAGIGGPDGQASIAYRGDLATEEVLVEVRLLPALMGPKTKFRLRLKTNDTMLPEDSVQLSRQGATKLNCRLQRRKQVETAQATLPADGRMVVLACFRSNDRIVVTLDYIPIAQLRTSTTGSVEGVVLEFDGEAGERHTVVSACIQKNPVSPDRTPGGLQRSLRFLRDALYTVAKKGS